MTEQDWYDLNGGKSPKEKRKEVESKHNCLGGWYEGFNGKKYIATSAFTSVDENGNKYTEWP